MTVMTLYFFDFRSDSAYSQDEEGVKLPDLQSAHDEAVCALADIIRDATLEGAVDPRISIEVRDQLGPVLEVRAVFESEIFRKH